MKLLKMGLVNRQEKGFTFIEVMIALVITGVIASSVVMVISGIVSNNSRSIAHMAAVKQVENAVHWVSQDVQMAQHITVGDSGGFPLTIIWTDWDNTNYKVIYNLDASGLERQYYENDSLVWASTVAQYIALDSAKTCCQYSSNVFILTLTAEVNNISGSGETRIVNIRPRSV